MALRICGTIVFLLVLGQRLRLSKLVVFTLRRATNHSLF